MISRNTERASAAFADVSGMATQGGQSGYAVAGAKTRDARRRGKGFAVLAGLAAFAALALAGRLLQTDVAGAYEKQAGLGASGIVEELKLVEKEVPTDISAVAMDDFARRSSSLSPAAGSPAEQAVSPPPQQPPAADLPPESLPQTVSGEGAQPPAQPLNAPQNPSSAAQPAQGQAQTRAVTRPDVTPGGETYYDSLPLPPSGPLAKKTAGPREVDPTLEPGSKFVIVTKDRAAGSVESLLASGNRALALGRYDAAVDIFDQLKAKNPRDRRVLMGRAVALQKAGRREAAKSAYEELLALSPDNREAQVNLLGLIGEDYPAVALRRMLDLRKKWPADAGLAAQIGLTQARLGNNREALDYLGIASSIDPLNAGHLFNMAVIADRAGDTATAIKLYEQALQTDTLHGGGRSVPRDTVYSRLSVLRSE